MQKQELIFLDTEFSSLDPYKGEILSIGIVKPTGEEFYVELKFNGEIDDWPKEHILPTLKKQISRDEAKKQIWDFVGKSKPLPVAFVAQFDIVYLHKLFGLNQNFPFGFPPIDFSSILFDHGFDPLEYINRQAEFAKKIGLNYSKITQHNALSDAKFMKMVWDKVIITS